MSMTVRDRQGLSESQAIANAQATDRPHLSDYWRSRDRRRKAPPSNVDGLVAWYREQWELELPQALHAHGVWTDSVTGEERAKGMEPQGGSILGSPRLSGSMRVYTEASPYLRDDEGDLVRPLAASMAALRRERRYSHDLVRAVAYSHFDWRSLIGKPFYRREADGSRTLVMAMPEDVMETLLVATLTRLWQLLAEREPHISSAA